MLSYFPPSILVAYRCLWKCHLSLGSETEVSSPSHRFRWTSFGYSFFGTSSTFSQRVMSPGLTALPSQWPCYHGPSCELRTALALGLHFPTSFMEVAVVTQTLVPCFDANWWKHCYCWMDLYILFLCCLLLLFVFGFGWYDCYRRVAQHLCSLGAFVVSQSRQIYKSFSSGTHLIPDSGWSCRTQAKNPNSNIKLLWTIKV